MAEMPVPQSSKARLFENHPIREGWEGTMKLWYASSLLLLIAVLGWTPNTEIETWAKGEARLRLQQDDGAVSFGEHVTTPSVGDTKSRSVDVVSHDDTARSWDKFVDRSVRWDKDDDDDDEDEVEEEEIEDEADELMVAIKGADASSGPGLWRRISNIFASLPDVQEVETSDEDDDEW